MAFNLTEFKRYSQDWYIARALLDGKSREEVVRELFPMVAEREPFIYKENIGGGRKAKPRIEQYRLFIYNVARTMGKMKKSGWTYDIAEDYITRKRWESKERTYVRWRHNFITDLVREGIIKDPNNPLPLTPPDPAPKPGTVSPVDKDGNPLSGKSEKIHYSQNDLHEWLDRLLDENLIEEVFRSVDGKVEPGLFHEFNENREQVASWVEEGGKLTREAIPNRKGKFDDEYNGLIAKAVKPKPEPPKTRASEIQRFYEQMMKAREFVISREMSGEYLDFVSTRAIKDGCKAIAYGIAVEEVLEAVTKTWPQDAKNELKNWTKMWKPKPWAIDTSKYKSELEGAHALLGYVEILAEARIPIFLVGPSGSGKSFMARDLADSLDMDYGEIPLTAGATPSWLVGAETISGYKSRPFVEIYENGGVFCFEEMDAADPNMLLLVNNALANESFTNPVTGIEISKHKNFIPVATANTWGLGATRTYGGRERLDAATLDRWRVGRVEVDYDEGVEKAIVAQWQDEARKREKPHKAKPKKVKA